LKRFGNQRWHGLLNKDLVRDLMFQVELSDEVEPRDVLAGGGRDALEGQLRERRDEHEAGTYPKGHIEEILLEAIQVIRGVPPAERDLEIRTESGTLVTVPDFAWPDAKVAVYCDGYQYHGDRDTLELDASKRNFLAQRGWTVLTYWGRQILQHPERCANQVAETVGSRARFLLTSD
jgi:hypothetical protein